MKINPSHLLLILLLFVFMPWIQGWVAQGYGQWQRPFLIWLLIILFIFFSQRRQKGDQL